MIVVTIATWLAFSFIAGAVAGSRDRNPGGWFLLSCLISPLIAMVLLLALPNLRQQKIDEARHEELMLALNPNYQPAITVQPYTVMRSNFPIALTFMFCILFGIIAINLFH